MILSVIAMGASAFVGVINKQTIELERDALAESERKVKETNEEITAVEDNIKDTEAERDQAKDARDMASATLNQIETKVKGLESTIRNNTSQLEKTNIEQKEIDLVVSKLGVKDVAELEAKEKTLVDRRDNLTSEVQAKNTEVEAGKEELVKVAQQVNQLKAYQIERAKKVALNGLEATVIATNKTWGFVLVNAGKSLGVSAEDSLLVKRGPDRVARLRIVSLEPDMVVAEVVEGSLPEGTHVQPGDKVIFENTK